MTFTLLMNRRIAVAHVFIVLSKCCAVVGGCGSGGGGGGV